MTLEKQAELHSVVVGPDEQHGITETGVYLLTSQKKGTAFPIFGTWKRREWKRNLPDPQAEDDKLSAIMVKPMPHETSPFMMKVSDKCPFLYVRNPAAANSQAEPCDQGKANCVVEEKVRLDMSDLFKVSLVLTQDIEVEGDPVELLCQYEFLKAQAGWKAHVPSNRRKSLAAIQANGKEKPAPKKRKKKKAADE